MSTIPDTGPVPPDLLCVICKELISAAVMLPCCAGSCCESCAKSGITCFGNCPLCQDDVEMEDLIPYRMLRDRIDKFNNKVKQVVEPDNVKTNDVSEILAEKITFHSSPSHQNNPEDNTVDEKNKEKVDNVDNISPRSLSLSSVSSSPSLPLSPVCEVNSGRVIPSLHSPRFTRQRHFSSSTAKFSSPWRGPSPHLSPVPRSLPRKAPPRESSPGVYLSRLQPHNDTLAQFQEAMKNMEEQKRARKLWQKQQQTDNKIIHAFKHIPEKPSPGRKRPNSHRDRPEDEADAVNESRSSTPSPIRNAMENCSVVSEGSLNLHGEYKKDEDGVKNSKHILCSGQIVQNPTAVAELKRSESKEGSTLKKALDNMKFVEEERMRKLQDKAIDHDSSSESEGTNLKKKKEKKKKRKKDKIEKAERKLRKLLKKKGLDKEVLAKILKKAKKKKSKKEAEVIELEEVSSPEPVTREERPPKPKISPIIERKIQHNEGKVQVAHGRREDRNRERMRGECDREYRHDEGGYHHPRRNESRDRSPLVHRSSFSVNNRNRHYDSYSGRLSRRRR